MDERKQFSDEEKQKLETFYRKFNAEQVNQRERFIGLAQDLAESAYAAVERLYNLPSGNLSLLLTELKYRISPQAPPASGEIREVASTILGSTLAQKIRPNNEPVLEIDLTWERLNDSGIILLSFGKKIEIDINSIINDRLNALYLELNGSSNFDLSERFTIIRAIPHNNLITTHRAEIFETPNQSFLYVNQRNYNDNVLRNNTTHLSTENAFRFTQRAVADAQVALSYRGRMR